MTAIVLTPDGGRSPAPRSRPPTPAEVAELAALDLSAGGADEILGLARP